MTTTKILSINVGNCQRIFENLKIDVLASSPVQTKKSLKSTRSKGGWEYAAELDRRCEGLPG